MKRLHAGPQKHLQKVSSLCSDQGKPRETSRKTQDGAWLRERRRGLETLSSPQIPQIRSGSLNFNLGLNPLAHGFDVEKEKR